VKTTDVAVVGAGPAGIAAALAAASTGAKTVLIDEQLHPGGNLRWRIAPIDGLPSEYDDLSGLPAFKLANALDERLGQSKVDVIAKGTAWGWFEENVLGVVERGDSYELKARSIVIASGSTDIVAPFTGSTLPGVMTARAVMIFLHVHRVRPGWRFAVIGEGQHADEVAAALETVGVEVVCRVRSVDGVRVVGDDQVREIYLPDRSFEVDTVAVALGRQPDPELALQALAQNVYSAGAGGIVPRRSETCETSTPGLYVAGEAAGIVSVAEAMAEGRLAGLAAAVAPDKTLETARQELSALRDETREAVVEGLRLESAVR
jgi:sarcosine oxidase subunit alpha